PGGTRANPAFSHRPGVEAETSIALTPSTPQTLAPAATPADSGQAPPAVAAYFSRDGGRTWGASSPLPLTLAGISFSASGDPGVAFDSRGNAYVSYVSSEVQPVWAVAVAKSTDGGRTFSQASVVTLADLFAQGVIADHPKMVIDTNPASPFRDTLYVTWDAGVIVGGRIARADLMLSRSTDGGQTWSTPQVVSSDPN